MSRKGNKILSPQIIIVGALLAIVGAAALALMLTKSEPEANAALMPRAARVERVEGEVGIARALADEQVSESDWTDATVNAPLTVGDRIYAKDGSRATLAFSGRNYARLDPGTSLDVLSLADRRTQLALRSGSAIFDVGDLEQDDFFEVGTPNGAVQFDEPGLYQLGFDEGGNTLISVLSGLAQVAGLAGSGEIGKGEILTLVGQTAAQALVSRIAPDLAGNVVDDYYDYRYDDYDGRYRDYDAYLDDPDYYDSYSRSASYRYVDSYDVPGLHDLDDYGDWTEVDGYGHCWAPRVDSGWAPYRNGSWDVDNVWGPTWVSQEPWGWAPYHYGRWAHVNNQRWVWVPERVSRPVYAPALVAFVPVRQTNQIAWVPLAPGEQYIPRYYNSSYEAQYLAPVDVVNRYVNVQRTYVNMSVPQAVTIVPVRQFAQAIRPDSVSYVNPEYIAQAQAQAIQDPYAFDSVRQLAIAHRGGRLKEGKRFKVGRGFDQVLNRPVVTSVDPMVPPAQASLAQTLQVRPLSEKQRKNRLKLEKSGQVATDVRAGRGGSVNYPANPQADGSFDAQERSRRKTALAAQVAQGDQAARRELKQLRKQERRGLVPSANQQPAAAQQQTQTGAGQQMRQERKALKRLDRQQQPVAPGVPQKHGGQTLQNDAARRQMKQQMKQQRRLEAQKAGRPAAAVAPQQNRQQAQAQQQMRQQRQAQKQAARQQQVQIQQQQSRQQSQAEQQMRQQRQAQKQAARQQRQMQAQQQQQVFAAPQKQAVVVQQNDKAQRRAERRATQQQMAAPQLQRQQVARPAQDPAQAQRKAEKAARKAARGNQ